MRIERGRRHPFTGSRQAGIILVLLVICGLHPAVMVAPLAAQDETRLNLLQPVYGAITTAAPTQRWTFSAQTDQRFALRAETLAGDLLPVIEVTAPDGAQIGETPPIGTPGNYRVIEGTSAPLKGEYSVTVSFDPTTTPTFGEYRLTLLPGFSYLRLNSPMDAQTPLRAWREPRAFSAVAGGKLRLSIQAENRFAWTSADTLGTLGDLYVQASAQIVEANTYWEMGLLVRGARADNDQNGRLNGYLFVVNSRDEWRFVRADADALTALQDWTALPNPTDGPATLAVLASGTTFTPLYNGLALGALVDATYPAPGWVGLMSGAGKFPDNYVTAEFDDLIVTLPVGIPTPDGTRARPPLAKIDAWAGTQAEIIAALHGAWSIPYAGQPGFAIEDAFVTNSTAGGIVFVPLARGEQFGQFVFAADITWDTDTEQAACALELRIEDSERFIFVYLDRLGGVGVRQVGSSDPEPINWYDIPAGLIVTENRATNRLIVVAVDSALYLYVNGQLVPYWARLRQTAGTMAIAAHNYAKANTLCRFNRMWLQDLDMG